MSRRVLSWTCCCLLLIGLGCLRVKPTESQAPLPTASEDLPERDANGDVDPALAAQRFQVKFETSKGDFVVEVHPEWAPRGAAQFRELVESGFYNDTRFFRVLPGFMVQWGINGNPAVQAKYRNADIPDDPVRRSNSPGMMTFATSGPNSRTTQVFINYGNNNFLDGQGFSPFAQFIEGMNVVEAINSEYQERPDQGRIQQQGNAYLNQQFPRLDYIKTATIIEITPPEEETSATPAESPTPAEAASTATPNTSGEAAATSTPPKEDFPPETIEEIK